MIPKNSGRPNREFHRPPTNSSSGDLESSLARINIENKPNLTSEMTGLLRQRHELFEKFRKVVDFNQANGVIILNELWRLVTVQKKETQTALDELEIFIDNLKPRK